jgi:hypothetical protein
MLYQRFIDNLNGGSIHRISILRDTQRLRYSEVLECWKSDGAFRTFFNRVLADAPFTAYFWEMPPVTRASIHQPFECVLVDSPGLAGVAADASAFAEYFAVAGADEAIAGFPSLGKDAFLIAPCPRGAPAAYPHLAAFVRKAPAAQQQALWQWVGTAVAERLSTRPLWLSTSGLGVYWLHVRLDSTPKYYTFRSYTQWSVG